MFLVVPWHENVIVYEYNHILWLSYDISMINAKMPWLLPFDVNTTASFFFLVMGIVFIVCDSSQL